MINITINSNHNRNQKLKQCDRTINRNNVQNNSELSLNYDNLESTISKLRRVVTHILSKNLKVDIGNSFKFKNPELKTLVNSLTFLAIKCDKGKSNINLSSNIILRKINNTKHSIDLVNDLKRLEVVNFTNSTSLVINKLTLNEKLDEDFNNYFSENSVNNPDARLAVQLFLNKGNFVWVSLCESEFKDFLFKSTKESLSDNARINCWEQVLYSLYKSKIISRESLQSIYSGNFREICDNLKRIFKFSQSPSIKKNATKSKLISNLSKTSNILMMDSEKGSGLGHDMISVPYTQKQIMKMLLTKKFNPTRTKFKIFSHWNLLTNKKLGTISKDNFINYSKATTDDFRKMSVSDFCLNHHN